jgi:hypothetical protein
MKIITLHKDINIDRVYNHLKQNVNAAFRKHKPTTIEFIVTKNADNTIDITQPELYEGILYHIEPDGNNLNITRSEHYVDDVNSLTLESAMNELFDDLSGKKGTDLVQEG